ncbi:CU044_2847 family protein [Streptomyces sp. NBC_00638]|nr:CU044_2847 family protein [Streptomyces sp. NBC_00638]MCX5006997.1 CU044_2847 family protein [Streptomyces sp. NBC_00638]
MQLISFRTADGGEAVVEIAEDEPGIVSVSRAGDAIAQATGSLEAGFDRIRSVAQTALDRLITLPRPPEEITLEFGVRFNAKAGAVIAHTEGEGHLKVAVVWRSAAT